jgi:hypothetical protein
MPRALLRYVWVRAVNWFCVQRSITVQRWEWSSTLTSSQMGAGGNQLRTNDVFDSDNCAEYLESTSCGSVS